MTKHARPESFTPQWWSDLAFSLSNLAGTYPKASRMRRVLAACERYCRARAERGW